MKKKILILANSIFLCLSILNAQEIKTKNISKKLEYKYQENDSYKILSTVTEAVSINNWHHHDSQIINRVSVLVKDVDPEKMTATHYGTFMTTEETILNRNVNSRLFTYGQEYKSVFSRDKFGVYTIKDIYFMPTVRDVPVFPDKVLSPGDTWTYNGHEVHDLRQTFGIQKPHKVPFTANYKYLGETVINDKILDVIEVFYRINFSTDKNLINQATQLNKIVPIQTEGYSEQTIYWDNQKGCIDNYSENFQINLALNNGQVYTFSGTASADVTDFQRVATQAKVEEITQQLKDLNIKDVEAKITEKGLTLSIENIQFLPDSNILLESEKLKLNKISKILSQYPNNDLLVSGHTALRGTEEERKLLSQERANAVANFLVEKKVKDLYHIFTQALGATQPIADNNTEEGRQKNRRVEITILD